LTILPPVWLGLPRGHPASESTVASKPLEVRSFAAGLRRDRAAVDAALNSPWSNGQTEGQFNKLKLLKRQMYGRANIDLLRLRLLYAA